MVQRITGVSRVSRISISICMCVSKYFFCCVALKKLRHEFNEESRGSPASHGFAGFRFRFALYFSNLLISFRLFANVQKSLPQLQPTNRFCAKHLLSPFG